jgi:hypothetical protein
MNQWPLQFVLPEYGANYFDPSEFLWLRDFANDN